MCWMLFLIIVTFHTHHRLQKCFRNRLLGHNLLTQIESPKMQCGFDHMKSHPLFSSFTRKLGITHPRFGFSQWALYPTRRFFPSGRLSAVVKLRICNVGNGAGRYNRRIPNSQHAYFWPVRWTSVDNISKFFTLLFTHAYFPLFLVY
jgi:hypothetical protein